jgi:predicted fused transcriptional regulator/phosphomethylpyrimidine kinase
MEWSQAHWDGENISSDSSEFQIVIGSGGFGWEPHIFIIGSSAGEVIDRTHAFIDVLEEEAV